jgi:hypothetical protein
VEVCTKDILYWFIQNQTHFGMPRGAKLTLALNKLYRLLFIQIQTLPPSMQSLLKKSIDFICKTPNKNSIGDQLLTKRPIELKDNSYRNCTSRYVEHVPG